MSNENLSETSSDNDDTIPLISDDEEHNESEDTSDDSEEDTSDGDDNDNKIVKKPISRFGETSYKYYLYYTISGGKRCLC